MEKGLENKIDRKGQPTMGGFMAKNSINPLVIPNNSPVIPECSYRESTVMAYRFSIRNFGNDEPITKHKL